MTSSIGPYLKGFVPPYTPTGQASIMRPRPDGVRPAHVGIVARWVAPEEYVASLLPHPLTPSDTTSDIAMFVNFTEYTGGPAADRVEAEPSETRFNEALIMIPCVYRGEPKVFHYIQYITNERAAYACNWGGYTTKLATIKLLLPFPPQPLHSGPAPGTLMKGIVARFDERTIDLTFEAREPVDPTAVTIFDAPLVGVRHFPDFTKEARGAAVVHDLVELDMANVTIAEAWSGDASVGFGRSETEELYHLEPVRMLESYYINGFTYHNRGISVLHDYLSDTD
jgi:acetoacetate decarboxylase